MFDINFNISNVFKCFKVKNSKKKKFHVGIDRIDKLDVTNRIKIMMLADELSDITKVIYINQYVNGELVNLYLTGTDIYIPQSFKDMYSLPIFYDRVLVGQIGICEISDGKIPEELTKLTEYLGKLIGNL